MPVDLDTDLITQVAATVRLGEWPQRALVRLGVPGSEAMRWLQVGEQRLGEGADPDVDEFARLWRSVDTAEADCEKQWIVYMTHAAMNGRSGTGNGRGSPVRADDWLKLLQARFPERWRKQDAKPVRGESMEEALARIQREGG
jgi:uncharacterized protein YifE (UPF0438 family)